MRRTVRRSSVFAVTLLMAVVGMVTLTGSAASARPLNNRVTQTAFIWNCPTGTPGCSAVQTRVGDVRTADPMTDVCRVTIAGVAKNLIYNRTARAGASLRTGFLYRSNLQSPNLQQDSCVSGGSFNNVPGNTPQRLCPHPNCGGVATATSGQQLREFCSVDDEIGNIWHLTVALSTTTGPLTAGFINRDDLNNATNLQFDCHNLI
ncbi:hypothetical protein [Plantactinospora soyae]|uniref:Uncharacterized protein n=1 Tax=Plantactinospora soyae TaxID=1544732 RepID=A0A927MD56_9ACTN|nr:hypothetical protein [Plantactinospora soyae]MBE1489563.1 hypothetical protein [Plantactinospora soyae]